MSSETGTTYKKLHEDSFLYVLITFMLLVIASYFLIQSIVAPLIKVSDSPPVIVQGNTDRTI